MMLTILEKILYLREISLFRNLGGDELLAIAKITLDRNIPANDLLFLENTVGDELYIIVQGKVEIYTSPAGKDVRIAVMGKNEYFSEMSILDDTVRSASARTLTDCKFLILKKDFFKELVFEYPDIALEIIKVFSQRIRDNVKSKSF